MKKVLHLNLYRKYFDQILKGEKTTEYREVTPYWSKRLEGRHYDVIQFRNGYAKVAIMAVVTANSASDCPLHLFSFLIRFLNISVLLDLFDRLQPH